MSLINDALRRKNQEKKEATQDHSDGTPMQAVSLPPGQSSFLKPILIAVILLMVLVAALLFWQGWQTKNQLANATKSPTPTATSTTQPTENTAVIPSTPAMPVPTNPARVAAKEPTDAAVSSPDPTTNVVPTPAVVPVALKLQGIFYRPSNPTAMINGKTVAVDELVSGARVLKIERQQVTVERAGKIETLTMD